MAQHRITVGEELRYDADVKSLHNLSGTYVQRAGGTSISAAPLPFVNVRDYGATGNGVTDDHAAIQAAIAATPEGGTLVFTPGAFGINDFAISAQLVISKALTIRGSWGKTLAANSASGTRLLPLNATVQQGMTSLVKVTASYLTWEGVALAGLGAANGSTGMLIEGTSATHAHGNQFYNLASFGFGHGLLHGAYSDHTTLWGGKIAGNTHGVGIAVNNQYDLAHIGSLLDGNIEASVHIIGDASAVNTSFVRCHLGFSKYGIYQDDTATGNGAAGLTLLDSPIEFVSVQHMRLVNGGNIRIDGGYWTWNGTPANSCIDITAVNVGPIWLNTRLDAGFPNSNAPAVINVGSYTNHPIFVTSSLNGFAQAMYAGQYKSPRVQSLTANGTYTVPPGAQKLRVQGRGAGGGGGGSGSALTSGGVTSQVGGSGGAAGSVAEKVLDVLPGQVYTVTIQSGGSRGSAGAANGGNGGNGGDGGDTTFTGTGGTVFAKGGRGGRGSAGNSTAAVSAPAYGSRSSLLAPGTETGGCGGGATSTGSFPGGDPIASSGGGGGGGGPATATNGGGQGIDGTTLGGLPGAAGASATANGVAGKDAFNERGSGGGGAGGGAPGGTGALGGIGTAGMVIVEVIA